MSPRSIAIAGGGMVGTACALRLQESGFQVTLVDPGDARRAASYGNIGHIATEQVEPLASHATIAAFPGRLFARGGALDFRFSDATLVVPWALRFALASGPRQFARGTQALASLQSEALEAWKRLCELAGDASLISDTGHNVVWLDAKAATEGLERWRRTNTGTAHFRVLEAEELEAYAPVLRQVPAGGIRFSGTGQFRDPQGVRDALRTAFRGRGGVVLRDSVRSVDRDGALLTLRFESGGLLKAAQMVVACGARSAPLMRQLGAVAPLIGERGYSVQTRDHCWPAEIPTTVFEERSFVVSRFSSGLRASSFLEFGDPDAPGDARKWEWLEHQMDELGIHRLAETDRWVGPRPTLPDYLPAIGQLGHDPRVIYAFGHQHLGMTLSAITAELVVSLAGRGSPSIDLAPFRVERFGRPWFGGR